jgi:hypothetical protein
MLQNMAYYQLMMQNQAAQQHPVQPQQPAAQPTSTLCNNPSTTAAANQLAYLLGLNQNANSSTNHHALLPARNQQRDAPPLIAGATNNSSTGMPQQLGQQLHANPASTAPATVAPATASSNMPPPSPSAQTSTPLARAPQASARGAAPPIPRTLLAPTPSTSSQRCSRDSVAGDDDENDSLQGDGKKKQKTMTFDEKNRF